MLKDGRIAKVERRAYTSFFISLAGILLVLFTGIFLGFALRNADLVRESVLARGRSLFNQIVLTRRWAAEYGGVYVKKVDGVESNPWLDHPDLEAADGSFLTLRNPALITREISEIAAREDDYRFKITSLKPLNPGNAADDFEIRALLAFDAGETELWETEEGSAGRQFRYMGALRTEASCLECHASQGYREGEIRGGISVSFSVESLEASLFNNNLVIVILALLIAAATLGAVFSFVLKLRRELDRVRAELEEAAIYDGLTRLYNRRFIMERLEEEAEKSRRSGQPLSCAIIDADDFKAVNDMHGHITGDKALIAIAEGIKASIRAYDIVGRYGGEEFIVLFPGASVSEAGLSGERICRNIAEARRAGELSDLRLSVSIGVATLDIDMEEGGIDALLRQADQALYRAKSAGKNQCLTFEPPSAR
jgi:diguanylate cyclase (GGDEF)-like protein